MEQIGQERVGSKDLSKIWLSFNSGINRLSKYLFSSRFLLHILVKGKGSPFRYENTVSMPGSNNEIESDD
jgi:hypothetical protein